jgi:hypothetical protein
LLAFNAGIELGQLLVLVLLVPFLNLIVRSGMPERTGTIIVSALVAHTGWHWLLERGERLSKYPVPSWNSATVASAIRWLILLLIITAIIWFLWEPLRHRFEARSRVLSAPREEP